MAINYVLGGIELWLGVVILAGPAVAAKFAGPRILIAYAVAAPGALMCFMFGLDILGYVH